MLSREWFSAAELAEMTLPWMPTTRQNMQKLSDREAWGRPEYKDTRWRQRAGRGGGVEYHYSLLPLTAQAKLAMEFVVLPEPDARAAQQAEVTRHEMWAWFDRQTEVKKATARRRLETLMIVKALYKTGVGKVVAVLQVAMMRDLTPSSIYGWERLLDRVPAADWLPYLAPRHVGRTARAEYSPEAWEFLKADYLRPEAPSFLACWRRLQVVAKENGWTLPSPATLERQLKALSSELRTLTREGVEALKRSYPAQQRDHGVFHALEGVNADTHKWDVFVRWPDGTVNRPQMVAIQDLYSGKILAWRVDLTPNKEALRLCIGDMVEGFGIPDHCWFDNGRSEASKWISGGAKTRYRFKIKGDDPLGVLPQLGVQVHFTTPYHGQSKPIERAFRDFAGDVAKHPKFAGAYTGNTPMAKPANYGNNAVPLELFLATVGEAIGEHNARIGRKSPVANGRSFDVAFAENYAKSPIRKATPEQRRLWLMAAEQIGVRRQDGTITLEGNRYYGGFLQEYRGHKVTVRFDPQALHEPLHVYRLDGAYAGEAACIEAVGFNDVDAAQAHARKLKTYLRAARDLRAAEISLTIQEVAALMPAPVDPPAPPESKVVRGVWGNTARQILEEPEEEQSEGERMMLAALAKEAADRGFRPRLVPDSD